MIMLYHCLILHNLELTDVLQELEIWNVITYNLIRRLKAKLQ